MKVVSQLTPGTFLHWSQKQRKKNKDDRIHQKAAFTIQQWTRKYRNSVCYKFNCSNLSRGNPLLYLRSPSLLWYQSGDCLCVCVCDTYDDSFRAMSPLSSEKTAKVNEHSESRDDTETALLCSALLCGIFFLIWAYWWTKCLCKQWVTQHMVNHVWVYCNMMYKVLIKSN